MRAADRPVDLTAGSLWIGIWQISWPMLGVMALSFVVGFTDVYVAGFISPEAQAAVGFVGQLYFFVIVVANAIGTGTLAIVSRAIGLGNQERAMGVARQSLIISLFIAVVLTISGLIFHRTIISLAGFPPEITGMAEDFLKVFSLSLGPNYVLIITNAVFRAGGDAKKPLLTMFVVSVLNVIGDFVLVFGAFSFPGMGYIGVALSTAGSVFIGMIINLFLFTRGWWRSFYARPWDISAETLRKIIGLGWPAAVLQIAWSAGTFVLYNILGRLGAARVTALAALTNGLRIEAVIYLPAFALHMAASVLIGQNLGAGHAERAEKIGWKIALAGAGIVSVISLMIFIQAERFASLLTKSPAVLEETTRYLRINMVSEPFMAMSSIFGGGLQGAGDTRGTMWVIVFAMWVIRLPLSYYLALVLDYGAKGVWVAMITSMIIQGMLMTLRFYKGQWKRLRID